MHTYELLSKKVAELKALRVVRGALITAFTRSTKLFLIIDLLTLTLSVAQPKTIIHT